MLAVYTLLVLAGYAIRVIHVRALRWACDHRSLPPATPRAIARAARRNRADLRRALPAREQGVRVTSARLVDPCGFDLRLPGEPPIFPPDVRPREERTQP